MSTGTAQSMFQPTTTSVSSKGSGRASKQRPHERWKLRGPAENGRPIAATALRESASQSVVRVCCEQTLIVLVTNAKRRATRIDPAGIIGLCVDQLEFW
jgi:hypothetical protein